MVRKQHILPIIKEICKEENIGYVEELSYGMYVALLFEGKHFFVKDINFNINRVASMKITKDKDFTSFYLGQFGYSVPLYTVVFPDDYCKKCGLTNDLAFGVQYARNLGYPVIIKQNDSSQGRGIYKAYDEEELISIAKQMLTNAWLIQIQKYYDYRDFRIVVLGENVISAYERIPLHVIGDGEHTIEQLLQIKQNKYASEGRDTVINIYGSETESCLNRYSMSLNSIPNEGQKITLRDVSNLSAGGECIDLTDSIYSDYKELCVSIAHDLNLDMCGIDILCPSICDPVTSYVVLEVNSAPGLDNYAYTGNEQKEYLKSLYRKIILYIRDKL